MQCQDWDAEVNSPISEAPAAAEVYQSKSIHLHPDDKHFTIPQTRANAQKWRQVRFHYRKNTNNKIDWFVVDARRESKRATADWDWTLVKAGI